MSETLAGAAPAAAAPAPVATPVATGSGAATGTAPAAAPASTVAAAPPAASSEAPAAAPAVETAPAPAASLLGDAKGDAPAEAVAEKPAEETKPAEVAAPVEVAKPTYAAFTVPEGVKLDDTKLGAYTDILGDMETRIVADPSKAREVVQEIGQKLVDLYVGESKAVVEQLRAQQVSTWEDTRRQWREAVQADKDIGGNRYQTSLQRAAAVIDLYGQQNGTDRATGLREAMGLTGSGDHPEMIKFVNWAASKLTERARPVPAVVPRAPAPTSKAARLYGKTSGAAA